MQIIAFEGIDKSGKHTQSELLFEKIKSEGKNVVKSEFHRYDTPTGKIIKDYLFGEYIADDYTIELIIAADKQYQQNWFEKLKHDGVDFLILDRYISSQEVYSKCKGVPSFWVKNLIDYLMKPSLEILIDIPAELSLKRKGKFDKDDIYEKDIELLKNVRSGYLHLFSNNNYIYNIRRIIVDGNKSIDKLHDDIWNNIKKYFKL